MDGLLIFIVYSAWALFSGYRVINGRYEWLKQKETKNIVYKILAVLGTGYVIGAFYIMYLVIRVASKVADGFHNRAITHHGNRCVQMHLLLNHVSCGKEIVHKTAFCPFCGTAQLTQ